MYHICVYVSLAIYDNAVLKSQRKPSAFIFIPNRFDESQVYSFASPHLDNTRASQWVGEYHPDIRGKKDIRRSIVEYCDIFNTLDINQSSNELSQLLVMHRVLSRLRTIAPGKAEHCIATDMRHLLAKSLNMKISLFRSKYKNVLSNVTKTAEIMGDPKDQVFWDKLNHRFVENGWTMVMTTLIGPLRDHRGEMMRRIKADHVHNSEEENRTILHNMWYLAVCSKSSKRKLKIALGICIGDDHGADAPVNNINADAAVNNADAPIIASPIIDAAAIIAPPIIDAAVIIASPIINAAAVIVDDDASNIMIKMSVS